MDFREFKFATFGMPQVMCLNPLSSCTALLHLNIRSCRLVTSLSPLEACHSLRHLDISENYSWDDEVFHLGGFPTSLTYLNLSCTKISNISKLR